MTKKNLMPVIILTAICIIVAALLAAVNALTAPIIDDRNNAAINESLGKVMEGGKFNSEPDELKDGAPQTISKVYTEKNGKGTVVVLVTNKGYTGKNIGITVGIGSDGKITGMQITQNEESIVPSELKPGGSYGDNYIGAGADDIPELETGATVKFTESAIKNALNDAFVYLGLAEEVSDIPREESEIEALAKELYGNSSATLVSSTPEDTTYVKRIYKENGKSSYIAYAFAISQYGTPEFEFLVFVDSDGTIKAVEKILWKVSDPAPDWGYNPPSEERVDELFAGLVGKNVHNIGTVDIVTGATNTAGRVRDAALEALEFASPSFPRDIEQIEQIVKEFYGEGAENLKYTVAEDTEYTGLIFKETGKSSYVAYAFAYSQYGTPEFEFLIKVGTDGKITAVKKILWKVSDPAPDWGYNPPSEERVDELFASFVGKSADDITSVDIATGATNTAGKVRDAALEALGFAGPSTPRDISEIEELAKELYGNNSAVLEWSEIEDCEYNALIFKESGKNSYITYAYSISQYGTPEFEILVFVGADGKIISVKKILWKVSDPAPDWGYNPPSEAQVDAFLASFVGKSANDITSVDIATGATNTAGKLRDAALEALGFAKPSIPRDIEEIEEFAKELYGNPNATLEYSRPEGCEYTGLIFKENGSNSYIAYAYSISQYGTPEFELLVFVGADGKIISVKKILWKVSDAKPDWGYNPPSEERVDELFASFVGKNVHNVTSVDIVTGATNTAGKLRDAVLEMLAFANPSFPSEIEEIEELAKELYGDGAENLEYTVPEDSTYIGLVFKESDGKSYIAYAFSYSQYGTPDFEFLVFVDADGTIKAVKKILWKVSDAAPDWGYNPPSEERVDELFASFVGKNINTINSVDISTGATNTSGKVRDAALEALSITKPEIPRDTEEIEELVKELYGEGAENLECTELSGYEYARLVFSENGKASYIVYAFSISQYGTPEFEFLIHVGEDGKIIAVKKILWKVSDAKPEWGYNPPSDEEVDAFFASLVGKNANTISSVEISTGATNTAGKVRDAALEAIDISDAASDGYAPRIVGICILALGTIVSAAAIVISKKRRTVKK